MTATPNETAGLVAGSGSTPNKRWDSALDTGTQFAGLTELEKAAAMAEPHMRECDAPTVEECLDCRGRLRVIRRVISAVLPVAVEPVTWRVQWYSRRNIGEPDRAQGRHDFPTEAEARAYLESEEVQSRVGPFWRVELQCQGPWVSVEAGQYAQEVEA